MSGVQTIEVSAKDADQRLDRWFKDAYPGLSFGRLSKLLRTGQVRLNGKRAKPGDRIQTGDMIRVPPLEAEKTAPAGQQKKQTQERLSAKDRDYIRSLVIHEDDDLFVLNKPSGLAVQGGTNTERHLDGLLAGLVGSHEDKPKLVHRLDRDTSGILVVARTGAAARSLTQSFRARDAVKTYWALVSGVPTPKEGEIDAALAKLPGRGPQGAHERVGVVDRDHPEAKPARTAYEVLEQMGRRAAFMALQPLTGRTHQLRAHMAQLGTPIVGDGKYGGAEAMLEGVSKKLHLHAREIDIAHPKGGRLNVTADLSGHMKKTWADLTFLTNHPSPFAADTGKRRKG
ncbi:MAG: RluA family pseudouridine synthase [Alphaproteobacteria bacterium]